MNLLLVLSIVLFAIAIVVSKNRLRSQKSAFFGALSIFIYLILTVFFIISNYFTGEGINDAVIYHLRYGLDGSGFGDYYLIISIGTFLFISSFVLAIFYYRMVKNSILVHHHILKRLISMSALIVAIALHPTVETMYRMTLKSLGYESALGQKYAFVDFYKTPNLQAVSDEHPNLVYIFAESFETTYFDEKLFPSLVNELRSIREQNIYFTDIKQVTGTSWTIAGMTSVLCGIPLVTPSANAHSPQGNSMSKMSSFYSGAMCMSDLLQTEGYSLTYRSGSPLAFAGVDKLYRTHHFNDIKGVKELQSLIKNPSYTNPWGLYDDTLFDIAFNDFKKLSNSKRKFALFLSTMDTHHPYGHVSKSCKTQKYQNGDNTMLNAVACSDELIARFIKQIQNSPNGKNTIIVVSSDHLSMHNMAIDTLQKGERRNQLMIIDPRKTNGEKIDKTGSLLDVGATLLPFLGYKAELGLGRNLLSEETSLVEEFGDFDKQLSAWSNDIAKFWEFPKIEQDLELNAAKKRTKIGKTTYKFPVLLRLNENLEVSPFFEVKLKFFETTKLFGYLYDFNYDDAFIWVDKCSRIASLGDEFNSDSKGKNCFAMGKLGSTIQKGVIEKNMTLSLEEIKAMVQNKSDEEMSIKPKEALMKIQEK